MATYSTKIRWWQDYICQPQLMVPLTVNGRYPVRVAQPAVAATIALEAALVGAGYRTPMGPTGSYLCRNIGGTDLVSLHSTGIAIDWDYPSNPYLRGETIPRGFGTDPRFRLTEAQIDAVEAIRNTDGDRLWKWLGWGTGKGADTMHFELDQPPESCQPEEDMMPTQQWHQFIDALFTGRPDEFHGDPGYWKTLDPDSPEWTDFWAAVVRVIS